MAIRAAIGLGSNLGDRWSNLERAIVHLEDVGDKVAESGFYETAPVGGPEQGDFLNAVVVVDTDLAPRDVLSRLLTIEEVLGRERKERWGPRIIDLDLLLYGDLVIDEPGLTVPHPGLLERRFVVDPLLEAWPDAEMPDGSRIDSRHDAVADQDVRPAHRVAAVGAPSAIVVFAAVAVAAVVIWWLVGRLVG